MAGIIFRKIILESLEGAVGNRDLTPKISMDARTLVTIIHDYLIVTHGVTFHFERFVYYKKIMNCKTLRLINR